MKVASAAMMGLALASAVAQAQGTMDKIEGTATELKGAAKAKAASLLTWFGNFLAGFF